jgi:glutaredoxin
MTKLIKPPNAEQKGGRSCYTSQSRLIAKNKIVVEYLYLDLNTCQRCIGTDDALDQVMMTLSPAFELAGFKVEYHKIKMETAQIAEQYMFLSSPTIRINGQDICQSVMENGCGCCSQISGHDIDCRVFEYNGKKYEVPPKEMLAKALLQKAFEHTDARLPPEEYVLPANLRHFFERQHNKPECTCQDNCC